MARDQRLIRLELRSPLAAQLEHLLALAHGLAIAAPIVEQAGTAEQADPIEQITAGSGAAHGEIEIPRVEDDDGRARGVVGEPGRALLVDEHGAALAAQ